MKMLRFKNIFQKNKGSTTQSGFTLVEISIVMIIIGLLIGGVFGGMKLVDNANVQKTIQDLKAIESSALTFRDTYRALPGDIRNPNTRIPNCTVAPCATTGNGNRQIGNTSGGSGDWNEPITATMEKYTFWHHLQAANLLQMDYKNTTDMNFGEGQPSANIGTGYRTMFYTGDSWNCVGNTVEGTVLIITNEPTLNPQFTANAWNTSCSAAAAVDNKMDDGRPLNGKFQTVGCGACNGASYDASSTIGLPWYDLQRF